MILEAVYEPLFSNHSHGFRPNRSCHTALKSLKKEFTGVSWFIEGDIKACFDSIDHHVLIDIIGVKIKQLPAKAGSFVGVLKARITAKAV